MECWNCIQKKLYSKHLSTIYTYNIYIEYLHIFLKSIHFSDLKLVFDHLPPERYCEMESFWLVKLFGLESVKQQHPVTCQPTSDSWPSNTPKKGSAVLLKVAKVWNKKYIYVKYIGFTFMLQKTVVFKKNLEMLVTS